MKIRTKLLLLLCACPLVLWNCTDILWLSEEYVSVEHKNFTLHEAKEFFNENTMQLAVTSRSMQDDGAIRLSAGEFTPDWDKAVASAKNGLMCYDVPIDCEHTYKAVMLSKENKTLTLDAVDVYQKLIIVKSRTTDEVGQYLLTLVPDIAYERQHQGKVADLFINAGNKGRFSGVAIYSIPGLDLIVRANRYINGIKEKGIFMSGSDKEMKDKVFWLKSIMRPFQLFRNPNIQSRTVKGEAEILDWAMTPGYRVEQSGYYYFLLDNTGLRVHEMFDVDGDGTPDTHTEFCCGYSIDPDTEEELCPYCQWAGCDKTCENLYNTNIEFDIDDFPGFDESAGRDCKEVSDRLMKQILGNNAYIGSSDNVIQLYEEIYIDGEWTLVGGSNANEGFNVLNEHLNQGRPITVGVNYEFGDNNENTDGTTDHFVVIYGRGYDENKEQYYFNYIETGRSKGNAQEAYSDNLRFYYNPNEGTFKGYDCYGLEAFDLVQIRPNNNR